LSGSDPLKKSEQYRIEGTSIIIFEIRPFWTDPSKINESVVAKATFIKSRNHWKVFWMRASGKWKSYAPHPVVRTAEQFAHLVEEDEYHCFWG
jgi:hypothetical protein